MGLTTYLIFLTLGIWLANKFLQAIRSPLRSVPGHFLARFTRLWYFKEVWTGTFPWTNIDLHQKHGPVVRIAPNEYSIDDPEAMKILYGHGTAFIKGPWYSASGVPHQANIFSDSNPKSHAVERRKFASLYSMSTLVTMEQAVDHCVDFLVDRLKEFSRSGATFDLQWWLQCFAFDTIGEISVSKRFGFLDAGNDALNIIDGLDNFLLYSARVGVFPETHPVIFKIVNMLGANGFQQVAKFATEQVQSYKKNVEGETFLGKALRIHQEQPQKLSETDILSICMMNVFAGSDTSSISLTSIMWCLLKNQHALAKVFGQDAHKFRPERWLVSKEAQQALDRYWLPFGHGSRTCIGKNIALMEISKVIPHLVRHFDLSLVDPNQEPTTHNVWFVKQQNIRVTAKVRDTTNL
ncbi:Cytochrome p450 pisatin [Lasiodiplodia theobromae]|uniref:Cytochrome p450 pisatin n=1 Tax=Lasiodiplodia theobromae TaxID=45133 RepID=UPI0015C3FE65|nr:Cytochrome p450 pisatin [Lasiodiplodia theobromae]KAF4539441.1 Cytochrome p450 pisatin [Lasiodiplodia theobromae]